MSDPRIRKLDRWNVDFAAAKIALNNLDILVHNVVQGQNAVVVQLRDVFGAYSDFAGDGVEAQRARSQAALLERVAANLRESTTKFSGKVSAQIQQAREQVSFMGKNVSKLRSAKPPQFLAAIDQVMQQVPEFLSVFDAYLARLTLELRIQQANFYKELGGAFTHVGRAEPTSSIVQTWLTQFEQIMPAVESLKYMRPQPKLLEKQSAQTSAEPQETAILAPVKWIHSRITRDVRDFNFSDPRKGFFNKPTHPPKSDTQTVVAAFDFEGQTESDLAFKRGDIIRVVDRGTEDDPNWWCGEVDGRRGLFPRNYIEERVPVHHVDEYIPRSGDEAAESSTPPRQSVDSRRVFGDPHRSDQPEESEASKGMCRSASLRKSDSLGGSALQEDFGDFNGPSKPEEQSPRLPNRPAHTSEEHISDEKEGEHAPKLPRRPRASQSHDEGPNVLSKEESISQVDPSAGAGLDSDKLETAPSGEQVGLLSDTSNKEPHIAEPGESSLSGSTKNDAIGSPIEGSESSKTVNPSIRTVEPAEESSKPTTTAEHEVRDEKLPNTADSTSHANDEARFQADTDSEDDLQIPDELKEDSDAAFLRSRGIADGSVEEKQAEEKQAEEKQAEEKQAEEKQRPQQQFENPPDQNSTKLEETLREPSESKSSEPEDGTGSKESAHTEELLDSTDPVEHSEIAEPKASIGSNDPAKLKTFTDSKKEATDLNTPAISKDHVESSGSVTQPEPLAPEGPSDTSGSTSSKPAGSTSKSAGKKKKSKKAKAAEKLAESINSTESAKSTTEHIKASESVEDELL